ncbi:MAG TPA: CHAD domain-containing protein, partial [Thermoanaerobaculia bacterium]|nr:CHAD domain-containing protein [Thermoanaerobaculia bacterium]
MPFRLRKKEAASAGIRRIVREQIDKTLELVGEAGSAEKIHGLRKRLKRIRAVVRLVRDDIGEKTFRRENRLLRELGRTLSPARDAAVRVSALDDLRKKSARDLSTRDLSPARRRLVARRSTAVRRVSRSATLADLGRELRAMRRRVRGWPLSKPGFACLERGLRRAYRDGRRSEADAYATR